MASAALTAEVVVTPRDVWSFGERGNHGLFAEHGDGSSWTSYALPHPPGDLDPSLVGATASSPGDVWAVGNSSEGVGSTTLAEHWDGHRWSVVPMADLGAATGFLFGVSSDSPDDVWAVGVIVGSRYVPLVEHWDGAAWQRVDVSGARATLRGVVAVSADDAWAVGNTNGEAGGAVALHWDGTSWSRVQTPLEADRSLAQVASVAAASSRDVWAVGSAANKTLALHFDGTAWTRVPTRNGVHARVALNTLQSVAVLPDGHAWAVGDAQRASKTERPLTERWNGHRWQIVASADLSSGGALIAVDGASPTSLWASGVAYSSRRNPRPLIEHWDGHAWVIDT